MKIILILFPFLFIYYCYYLIIFYKGLKKRYFHSNSGKPFVSVIVAARNEEATIHNLLTTLTNQDYPENSYEIIIANDQSSDRTAEIVQEFQQKFSNLKLINIRIVDNNISRKKNALSKGIKTSKGKIILTTDADCLVKPTWISGMVRYFGQNVGMVAGFSVPNILNWKNTSFVQKYEYLDTIALFSAAAGSIGADKSFSCSGQNLAYTRDAYAGVGGFEKIKNYISGDDILLMQLIRKSGYKIRFAFGEETYNLTNSERQLGKFLNQRIRWASNEKAMTVQNQEFFFFLVVVFLLNAIIVTTLFFSLSGFLGMLFFKILADRGIISSGFRRFGLPIRRLRFLPLWTLIQPFYIILVGICGRLNLFKWNKTDGKQEL